MTDVMIKEVAKLNAKEERALAEERLVGDVWPLREGVCNEDERLQRFAQEHRASEGHSSRQTQAEPRHYML